MPQAMEGKHREPARNRPTWRSAARMFRSETETPLKRGLQANLIVDGSANVGRRCPIRALGYSKSWGNQRLDGLPHRLLVATSIACDTLPWVKWRRRYSDEVQDSTSSEPRQSGRCPRIKSSTERYRMVPGSWLPCGTKNAGKYARAMPTRATERTRFHKAVICSATASDTVNRGSR
jgi:hypothetical protein